MASRPILAAIHLSDWPFDLKATLNSGQVFHWAPWDLGMAGLIGEQPVYVEQISSFELRCTAGKEQVVRRYFGLGDDWSTIAAAFPQSDRCLARAIAWCPGLRMLRQPQWECLATFITSSLKQVAHIRQISLTLRERFGRPVRASGMPLQHLYPDASILAEAGENALRECGLGYRAAFLHRAAVQVASGELNLESISAQSDEAALASLCTLHGVGEKIASCALLFAWERFGVFPIDVWIERVLRNLYFPPGRKVTSRQVRDFARNHFGPRRGYAQQFLFHWARMTGCGTKT